MTSWAWGSLQKQALRPCRQRSTGTLPRGGLLLHAWTAETACGASGDAYARGAHLRLNMFPGSDVKPRLAMGSAIFLLCIAVENGVQLHARKHLLSTRVC